MNTQSTFNINFENITKGLTGLYDYLLQSQLQITSKSGKEYIKMPTLLAVLIGILFPFSILIGVILSYACGTQFKIKKTQQESSARTAEYIQLDR